MRRIISAACLLTMVTACDRQRHHSHVLGSYSGPFMNSPLQLEITKISSDSVWGISQHKDQVRPLAGTLKAGGNGYRVMLAEPGDSPYDGVFDMFLDTTAGTLKGAWLPKNNPELSETAFELTCSK